MKRNPGFTLIELMIVVSIIGLLSAIAIPGYKLFVWRAERTERVLLVAAIEESVKDYFQNANALPDMSAAPVNPPLLPAGSPPRRFNAKLPGWNALAFSPELFVRYSYFVSTTNVPIPTFTVFAYGDLDSDGVINTYFHTWQVGAGGVWNLLAVSPDDGLGPW